MPAYSSTPLAKKLGIKAGFAIKLVNAPDYYFNLFTDLPPDLILNEDETLKKDFIHFYTKSKHEYLTQLPVLKQQLKSGGMIWASWPKKASKIPTGITEDIIRSYAIDIGLVDIKVCSVDDIWSGLKLVVPLKQRS